jgi:transposase
MIVVRARLGFAQDRLLNYQRPDRVHKLHRWGAQYSYKQEHAITDVSHLMERAPLIMSDHRFFKTHL